MPGGQAFSINSIDVRCLNLADPETQYSVQGLDGQGQVTVNGCRCASGVMRTCWGTVGFPGGSDGKESTCNVGDLGSIPGLGGSPEGGNGNPLQHSCLENSMNREAWQSRESQRVRHD